jgi:hypothetical protein
MAVAVAVALIILLVEMAVLAAVEMEANREDQEIHLAPLRLKVVTAVTVGVGLGMVVLAVGVLGVRVLMYPVMLEQTAAQVYHPTFLVQQFPILAVAVAVLMRVLVELEAQTLEMVEVNPQM